ncbi:polyribonucleotide nucleotidyltransferase [Weeksellaceae bacterium KMM 9713]|uniref:Polyribonucleotide nucleotidyltransferase n=2 Tax=Pseudomonadati TaxID=3379134 RepID=A0A9X4MWQ0_9FLAO|nr:polyribonucleotide nucleotidyltransferase [Profundicola chukchiensis]MDG4946283.1 polyribonucleotide nucleotidyltransferase [Profundicola chukchiensis]
MNNQVFTKEIRLEDGRSITLETGKLAKQADGSVVVKMGGTMLLATVVSAKDARDGVDFMPLTVEYREKFTAAGKIPGGFFKREGRPTDEEILTMRLVDRVLRPMFPDDYHAETQVIISVYSYDGTTMPDSLAGLAASTAIALTDIPFKAPLSEVRVARVDGKYIINPDFETLKTADMDIMVGATADSVVMVEGEFEEVSEQEMLDAIKHAHEAIKVQIQAQIELAEAAGVSKEKRVYEHETHDRDLEKKIHTDLFQSLYDIAKEPADKHVRAEKFDAVLEEFLSSYSEEELEEVAPLAKVYFSNTKKEAVRQLLLEEGIRLDGRKPTEIRPIWSEVDYLPSTHGSAVFTRGETQSLTSITLGSSLDVDRVDSLLGEYSKKFYLHYNFPPFSTGEARPIRGTSRREIGHGNLAERALKKMIPEDNPYTVRVVSDILESNGSSSMATVCAGTLALMDAGIKLKKPVSGIAMGLITDTESGKWTVLSDILGDEDHLGDMDFKVTGTKDGITACQMDIKVDGLAHEILEKALMQAKEGRLHILGEMMKTISEPNEQLKANAPKIVTMRIPSDYIGALIGPGGKMIQAIQADTGTNISIEEDGIEGIVEISGVDQAGMDEAIQRVKDITFEPEVGAVYTGKVVSTKPFGAFVEIKKGTEGLVHISELEWHRVNDVEDVVKVGDEIQVKYLENDPKSGKMRLSRKVLLPRPDKKQRNDKED